ncbi:unnamed protein product [Trichogramma brassicae]|uniref:Uncharacterized protein n=1 Tax=Trichogramma brassicae TaxID=86971 RepID=A0A6H5IA59_9HYME|nr:unnamed protein product [Trichogramma brassicae]
MRNDFVPVRVGKVRYLRRGRYAKRCIDQAFESFRIPTGKTKPTLLKRAHYFERIVGDVKKSLNGEKDDSNFLRVILLTSLAYSLRDTYDAEILHRGSSRRNSRRMSSCSRRQSMVENLCPYENGVYVFRGRKNSESLQSLQSTCAEGRRRLSVMGMLVADKINYAMRTDLAREEANISTTPEPKQQAAVSETESRPQSQAEIIEIVDSVEEKGETQESTEQSEPKIEEPVEEEVDKSVTQVLLRRPSNPEVDVEVAVTMDRDKIKELVTTEISLERQLENVQSQLMALKQLPSEIERHLKVVSEQLHKIMELSGVEHDRIAKEEEEERAASVLAERENEEQNREDEEAQKQLQEQEEQQRHEDEHRTYDVEDGRQSANSGSSSWAPNLASLDEDLLTNTESKELEISVKSDKDDGSSVKKYIVSYESKVIEETKAAKRSRDPSPAHRQGRKRSRELWQPQARQLELTYGRRWRCPNDFFNDDMIADVLSSQAEVIRGRAMGVNFKKFEKAKALPNYDHLMASSVYKMIHKMEVEPKKGIPARPSRVVAAEDIIERVNYENASSRSCFEGAMRTCACIRFKAYFRSNRKPLHAFEKYVNTWYRTYTREEEPVHRLPMNESISLTGSCRFMSSSCVQDMIRSYETNFFVPCAFFYLLIYQNMRPSQLQQRVHRFRMGVARAFVAVETMMPRVAVDVVHSSSTTLTRLLDRIMCSMTQRTIYALAAFYIPYLISVHRPRAASGEVREFQKGGYTARSRVLQHRSRGVDLPSRSPEINETSALCLCTTACPESLYTLDEYDVDLT